MALPAGLYISKPVQYLPNVYDAGVWNLGEQGPVAALITAIDAANNKIDLVIFPPGAGPFYRSEILYYSDAGDDANAFKLDTDTLTCGTDVSGIAITDTSYSNFVVEFTQPTGSHGFLAFYRDVTGDGTWLTPNQPGNKSANYEANKATFTDMDDGATYDILIKNICNNGVASSGVTATDTATTPL